MIDARDVLDRFRSRFPDLSSVADGQVLAITAMMLEHSEALGLGTTDEVADVLGLRFSLTDEQMKSSFCSGVLRSVLSNHEWPLVKRLSFLRRHLVGRAVQREDEDRGRSIFGAG